MNASLFTAAVEGILAPPIVTFFVVLGAYIACTFSKDLPYIILDGAAYKKSACLAIVDPPVKGNLSLYLLAAARVINFLNVFTSSPSTSSASNLSFKAFSRLLNNPPKPKASATLRIPTEDLTLSRSTGTSPSS